MDIIAVSIAFMIVALEAVLLVAAIVAVSIVGTFAMVSGSLAAIILIIGGADDFLSVCEEVCKHWEKRKILRFRRQAVA